MPVTFRLPCPPGGVDAMADDGRAGFGRRCGSFEAYLNKSTADHSVLNRGGRIGRQFLNCRRVPRSSLEEIFSANCISLCGGEEITPVIVPNAGSCCATSGMAKCGVLTLNSSTRNSVVTRSKLVIFSSEESRFWMPGPRTAGKVRPTVPKVYGGGVTNAAVLKYARTRCWFERFPWILGSTPGTRFGRLPAPTPTALSVSGKPLCSVRIEVNFQPPTSRLRPGPTSPRKGFPCPNGSSAIPFMTRLCGWSSSETLRSARCGTGLATSCRLSPDKAQKRDLQLVLCVRLFFSYTAAHGPHGTSGGKGRAGAHQY